LVSALRKRGDAPLVVGHSLGGGMAQYVGFKFGLKVVGFNLETAVALT
jgi:putative lipase involved disintegration of autophagic bodies